MTKRVYFLVHGGTVQGVGFRYFTRRRAIEYGITGWCSNTPSNKVEGEAQGDDEAVTKFVTYLDDGPRRARVVRLDCEDRDVVEGESGFEIRQ